MLSRAVMLCAATLVTTAACTPLSTDAGAAQLRIVVGDESQTVIHDPTASDIALTPPTAGIVELAFVQHEPLIDFSVRLDANVLEEAQVVTLPLGDGGDAQVPADALHMQFEVDGIVYTADGAGTSGDIALTTLVVSEADAEVRVDLTTVTLVSADGATVELDGFVEGAVLSAAE